MSSPVTDVPPASQQAAISHSSVTDEARMPMLSWRNPFPRVSVESYVDKGVISAWGTPDSDQPHTDIR